MADNQDLSGWEIVDNKKSIPKKNLPKGELSDWQVVRHVPISEQSQNESFGTSAVKAPFRVAEDLYKGAAGFVKNIPGYLDKAKTEVPGILNPINALKNPLGRTKQATAGLLELGQKINHLPRDLAQYSANRLNLIPQEIANKVPAAPDITQDINKYLGTPQNPGDALLRGVTRNLESIIPGAKLANAINPLNMTNKAIAKQIVRETNKQVNRHATRYNNLFNRAEQTGFNEVPINQHLINNNLDFIRQYRTPLTYRGIEEFSAHPTLQNAQAATSDLKKITRGLDEKSKTQNLTSEERQLYDAAHHTTQEIENNMFRNQHGERNEMLANRHRAINSSYRENVVPYRYNKAIQQYMDKQITRKQLVNSLSDGEFGAKKLNRHPSLAARNTLPKAFVGTGALGGLGWLYDEMFGHNNRQE